MARGVLFGRSLANGPDGGAVVRIAVLVEGKTELAFKPYFANLPASTRLAGRMPTLDFVPYDGRIPTGDKLRRVVANLLTLRTKRADAVIAPD